MSAPVRVAILGASGYGAGELLRLLAQHPYVRVVAVVSSSRGQDASPADVHPHLRGFYDGLRLSADVDLDELLDGDAGVLISALPHGASADRLDALLTRAAGHPRADRLRAIDLSGDLRLKDAEVHARHYPHTPALAERRAAFVYGLSELNRAAVRRARCVANPGCLASAAILAVAPLVGPEFAGPIIVDAKTGSSGSGRELKETTHHPTRHADFRAYKPLEHQHEPEILQALGDEAARRIRLSFVAQSMDCARGIYATVHLELPEATDPGALRRRYAAFYAGSPFVRVRDDPPALQNVVGSNFCDLGVACRGRQVVAMAALDNLVKGMAGAAIQNMNLMCGIEEKSGLWAPSFRPV